MDSLIQNATKYADERRTIAKTEFELPKIMVIGVGGAGCNTITRLTRKGVRGAETIAINTDHVHLAGTEAEKKILIGKTLTKGLGAGGFPSVGEQCAEIGRASLEEVVKGVNLAFVTCGMGGGTGTGATPIVAEIAKQQDAIVVGIVSTPFNFERARMKNAEEGIEKMRKRADSVIVLDNNRLLQCVPNLPVEHAFAVMDELIAEFVVGITETITQPSLINLDYADVKTIMTNGGVCMLLYGESQEQDPEKVVKEALNHPLLDVDYKGATGCLLHITGGPTLTLKEAHKIAEDLTEELDENANVILGARIKDEGESIKVMAIMTGVKSPNIFGPNIGLLQKQSKKKEVEKDMEYKSVDELEAPKIIK